MNKAIKDFLKVFFTNLVLLASGILAGFFIPKIMGVTDYGYYKTFSLYNSYKELLSFGICEGMYLWLAGKDIDYELQTKLKFVTKWYFIIEISEMVFIVLLSSCFFSINHIYALVFILVGLFCCFSNIESYFASISQSLKNFTLLSRMVFVKSILTIVSIISLFLYHKFFDGRVLFYYYSIITIALCVINDAVYLIVYKKYIFNHNEASFREYSQFLKKIVVLGIPLLLSNLCQSFLLTIDKQVISFFYPIEKNNVFATFSFAYNLLTLITSIVSAISTVLFPYMKGKEESKLISIFPTLHTLLLIVLSLSCCSYYLLVPIITHFLPQYVTSLPIFKALLPGLLASSTITILLHSYYKTFDLEKDFFIQSIIVLILALVADLSAYFLYIRNNSYENPILIVFASTAVMVLWYFICILVFNKKHKVLHIKNDLFLLVSMVTFYLAAYLIENWIIGFVVYFFAIIIEITALYWRDFSKMIIIIKERKR